MLLTRYPHSPAELITFYEETLTRLGALCDRVWHDRLAVVAEGPAAQLWNPAGELREAELHFPAVDATGARDAGRDVFPGCPLTFKLAEAARPSAPLAIERFVLPVPATDHRAPDPALAEKRWRAQFSTTTRWQMASPFTTGWHFSLLALVRCEVQAIDQHWHLFRLALSLPDGAPDEDLARNLVFHQDAASAPTSAEIPWPPLAAPELHPLLSRAIGQATQPALAAIRERQEHSLRREIERIDDYFADYRKELEERGRRSRTEGSQAKVADRLAAAQIEHTRRRADQVSRHEIRIIPHLDTLLLLAEPAWHTTIRVEESGHPRSDSQQRAESLAEKIFKQTRQPPSRPIEAHYIPRTRRWERAAPPASR